MRLAIELAEKGRGKTSPNPLVGAVIVRGSKIIGQGYHRALGREHAEVAAINKAGRKALGSTLFVNLEPCCHTGRTGPCTEAIIAAGISLVVMSTKDPNPVVNGKGIRILRKAGIEVQTGLLKQEARRLNDAYIGYYENGRPYVILKLAQSLDGRIATHNGDSKWISSAKSRKFSHGLRADVDAVVVGAGTVRRDNPALTVRNVKGSNPYRIILTESANIPPKSALLSGNGDMKTIIASSAKSLSKLPASKLRQNPIFWSLKRTSRGQLDLLDFIAKAADFGLRSILVEGGSTLATSFLKADLVDKFVAVTAPLVLGQGVSSLGNLSVNRVADAIRFDEAYDFPSGPDRIFIGYPKRGQR